LNGSRIDVTNSGDAQFSGMPVKVWRKATRSSRSASVNRNGCISGERLGRSMPPVS